MRSLLIVNPVASRVTAAVEQTAVRELEEATTVEVVRTTHHGEATHLAERAAFLAVIDHEADAAVV